MTDVQSGVVGARQTTVRSNALEGEAAADHRMFGSGSDRGREIGSSCLQQITGCLDLAQIEAGR
jgi:hypothetical protein